MPLDGLLSEGRDVFIHNGPNYMIYGPTMRTWARLAGYMIY